MKKVQKEKIQITSANKSIQTDQLYNIVGREKSGILTFKLTSKSTKNHREEVETIKKKKKPPFRDYLNSKK